MGIFNILDDVTSYLTSDIKTQTGKGFFKTFTDTGNYGEFQSYKYLFMTPGKRQFIHNCYIPTEKGSTEIDLLMIHETGLYVIESKNYSGWIFGDETQKEWTQVLPGGKEKNRFYNPIWQNAGHIKALRSFLCDYPDLPICSLVVFSERCELKKVSVLSSDAIVIKRDKLKSVFKKQIQDKDKVSSTILFDIYQRLLPLCKKDQEEKQQHIYRINAMKVCTNGASAENIADDMNASPMTTSGVTQVDKTQSTESLRLCPRCGAQLVERKGKNGTFIGCSAFPKCRYTRN